MAKSTLLPLLQRLRITFQLGPEALLLELVFQQPELLESHLAQEYLGWPVQPVLRWEPH